MWLKIKLLLIGLMWVYGGKAQLATPDFFTSCVEQIRVFNRTFPQEKVYLHFDNTSYFVGDTLWFKAWLVYAPWHKPMDWSRTLYVDLLTQEGEVVFTKRFKLDNGQCHGDFALSDSLSAGYYEIRAYTRWMLNFGPEHEFSCVFPIFSQPQTAGNFEPVIPEKTFKVPDYRNSRERKTRGGSSGNLWVSFFPEGGNLVKGLTSVVAFKAVNRYGEHVNVDVNVRRSTGENMIHAATMHDGMGVFSLCPDGSAYTAEVIYEGKSYHYDLPEVLQEGCVMNVNTRDTAWLKLHIVRSLKMLDKKLKLMVLCRGEVLFTKVIQPTGEETVSFKLSTVLLPTGVSQIIVLDEEGDILAERMVFINHKDWLHIQVSSDRADYPPFAKVNMALQVKDSKGNPVQTQISLAVRDASLSFGRKEEDNILTYFLLTSELRGYIHRPGYYFVDDSPARRYALDLLMLTQGWSRYSWKRMTGQENFNILFPAEEAISIDGQIYSYATRPKPLAGVDLLLMMRSGEHFYRNKCQTDSLGRFVFGYDLWGTWQLTLQVKSNGKYKNADIRLNRDFRPQLRKLSFYEKQLPLRLDSLTLPLLVCMKAKATDTLTETVLTDPFIDENTHLLEEARVKKHKLWQPEEIGLKHASIVYPIETLMDRQKDLGKDKAITIFDFLREYNPYFYSERPVSDDDKYKGRPVIYVINNVYSEEYGTLPLKSIVPEQVKYIAINESYGTGCQYIQDDKCESYVVIYIYTTPGHQIRNSQKGIRHTKLEGYAYVKEFYSPQYNRRIFPGETDNRRTLYWNPCVQTDSLGKANISFYNNSSCRKMNISAETITSHGNVGIWEQ